MLAPFRRLVLVASALLLLLAPAIAVQDVGGIAAEWGLLGTWAVDCARPPSLDSAHLSFVRAGNKLVHRRNFGERRDEFPVTAARNRRDGSLEIELKLASLGERRIVVFAKAGEGKKRAMLNRAIGGDYSIRDGKFVGSGAPTPVQTRCPALTN